MSANCALSLIQHSSKSALSLSVGVLFAGHTPHFFPAHSLILSFFTPAMFGLIYLCLCVCHTLHDIVHDADIRDVQAWLGFWSLYALSHALVLPSAYAWDTLSVLLVYLLLDVRRHDNWRDFQTRVAPFARRWLDRGVVRALLHIYVHGADDVAQWFHEQQRGYTEQQQQQQSRQTEVETRSRFSAGSKSRSTRFASRIKTAVALDVDREEVA